jgi:hypothetical protein
LAFATKSNKNRILCLPSQYEWRSENVGYQVCRYEHVDHPTYHGVTLDRSLTYNAHLTKTAKKVNARVNLVRKLDGTNWGASSETLSSICSRLLNENTQRTLKGRIHRNYEIPTQSQYFFTYFTFWYYFTLTPLFQIVIFTNSNFEYKNIPNPPTSGQCPSLDRRAIHVHEVLKVKLKYQYHFVFVRYLVQKCLRRRYDLRYIVFTISFFVWYE